MTGGWRILRFGLLDGSNPRSQDADSSPTPPTSRARPCTLPDAANQTKQTTLLASKSLPVRKHAIELLNHRSVAKVIHLHSVSKAIDPCKSSGSIVVTVGPFQLWRALCRGPRRETRRANSSAYRLVSRVRGALSSVVGKCRLPETVALKEDLFLESSAKWCVSDRRLNQRGALRSEHRRRANASA